MKKMDASEVFYFAKTLIPAGRDSKVLSLVYEIHNGELLAEVLEGDTAAAESEAHVVAGVFACMLDKRTAGHLVKIFQIANDPEGLMTDLARRIDDFEIAILTEEKGELSVSHPPETAAALVATQDQEGRHSYLLYRHPQVDRDRAILLLKLTLRTVWEKAAVEEVEALSKN